MFSKAFGCIADVIADLILMLAPLRLFAILRDNWVRYRLIVIFSTCIITTVVSLVHAVYILTTGGSNVIISALVEVRGPSCCFIISDDPCSKLIGLYIPHCVQHSCSHNCIS